MYYTIDLVWKPVGHLVRFILVKHPTRGNCILVTTDLTLMAMEVIAAYGLRFKIEISFKQALHTMGTWTYHFWMKTMKPLKRGSGNQHLHRESEQYRNKVDEKMRAYHAHVQAGLIAQGLLQYLSLMCTQEIWASFGSWLRTIRADVLPSEQVVAKALRNQLPGFIDEQQDSIDLAKFIAKKREPASQSRKKYAAG